MTNGLSNGLKSATNIIVKAGKSIKNYLLQFAVILGSESQNMQTVIDRFSLAKSSIKSAIEGKGVVVNDLDLFDTDYHTRISEIVQNFPEGGWQPNPLWLDLSTLTPPNTVALLMPVYEFGRNRLTVRVREAYNVKVYANVGGALVSDTNFANDVTSNTDILWSDIDAATLVPDCEYRQAVVLITPQGAGNLTYFISNSRFVKIRINLPNSQHINISAAWMCEVLELSQIGTLAAAGGNLLANNNGVKHIEYDFDAAVPLNNAFRDGELQSIMLTNTQFVNNFLDAFRGSKLRGNITLNVSGATGANIKNMFLGSLINCLNLTGCAGKTDISNILSNCPNIRKVSFDDFTDVTETTNSFFSCPFLTELELWNLGVSFSLASTNIDLAMVQEIGNNQLKDLTSLTAQNFTITGTPAASDAGVAAYAATLLATKNWNLIY
jgi:hypothetical protein